MKLYFNPLSPPSRAVMLFASEVGLRLRYQLVDLHAGEQRRLEYLAINPNGLVPVLEDGSFRLTESSAILRYLADSMESTAYPRDLRERARVNETMDWVNSNLYRDLGHGLVYPQLLPHHRHTSDTVQAATIERACTRTRAWLTVLDQSMLDSDKSFLGGQTPSLADYFAAPVVTMLDLVRCDYAKYPNVQRWLMNVRALSSWADVNQAFASWVASVSKQSFVAP